jgi:hypothetical protein
MKADSKLWILEYLLEPGPGFSVAKLLDIEVLVMGAGRERSIDEYTSLLGSVGLVISKVFATNTGPALLECVRKEESRVSI